MNFKDWQQNQETILFDSSMGLGLKELGFDVNNKLWTAKALITAPDKVYQVHKSFFDAGSNVASTDTYQANLAGFLDVGYTEQEAQQWITDAVKIAQRARDDSSGQQAKWVAGAIGPYGAYLADGSEYTGDYSLSDGEMRDFHLARMKWLVAAGVDLLAFKTIPSFAEVKVLCNLLNEFPDTVAYFACSLRDAHHISDGTDLREVQAYLAQQSQIVAAGFNCFHPRYVADAIKYVQENTIENQRILVAPNAGGHYDPELKKWGMPISNVFADHAVEWQSLGASWIGGCCELSADEFRVVHDKLNQ